MSIISISKARRQRRIAKKQHVKNERDSYKVELYVDEIELDRFTDKMIDAFTEHSERRNAILSKIGVNKS